MMMTRWIWHLYEKLYLGEKMKKKVYIEEDQLNYIDCSGVEYRYELYDKKPDCWLGELFGVEIDFLELSTLHNLLLEEKEIKDKISNLMWGKLKSYYKIDRNKQYS